MRIKPLAWFREGCCIRSNRSLNSKGYPEMMRDGKRMTVARKIIFRRHGELPPSVVTRHTCDNRWCINPDHLLIGTQGDNTRDRAARGRNRDQDGSKSSTAKLTYDQVQYIRTSSKTQRQLASELGVHYMTVHYAKHGITWKTMGL